ncbi:hypothetical protein, conserved [Leishmania tarentolae]|uniref:Secreted protein n=1 Tax=Leishmania tarentolae TaxID=5689 RepID=A0A640KUG5_LEITA|nr:hypothetical protein, conserved [Leishmania tarentolae]
MRTVIWPGLEVVLLHVVADHCGCHRRSHLVAGLSHEKLDGAVAREGAVDTHHTNQHGNHGSRLVLVECQAIAHANNHQYNKRAEQTAGEGGCRDHYAWVACDCVLDPSHALVRGKIVPIDLTHNTVKPGHCQHLLGNGARQQVNGVDGMHSIHDRLHFSVCRSSQSV